MTVDRHRRWREENADRIRAYRRDYYARNRDRILEADRQRRAAYRAEHPLPPRPVPRWTDAYKRDYMAAYFADPDRREMNIARASARSARLRFGEELDWRVFLALRRMPCVVCGVTPSRGVDHIVPRIAGGRNVLENVVPMCRSDNAKKTARDRRHRAMLATLRQEIADGHPSTSAR